MNVPFRPLNVDHPPRTVTLLRDKLDGEYFGLGMKVGSGLSWLLTECSMYKSEM